MTDNKNFQLLTEFLQLHHSSNKNFSRIIHFGQIDLRPKKIYNNDVYNAIETLVSYASDKIKKSPTGNTQKLKSQTITIDIGYDNTINYINDNINRDTDIVIAHSIFEVFALRSNNGISAFTADTINTKSKLAYYNIFKDKTIWVINFKNIDKEFLNFVRLEIEEAIKQGYAPFRVIELG